MADVEEEVEDDTLLHENSGTHYGLLNPEEVSGSIERHDYESAILETGYGKFHYSLLLLCGWAVSSDAIEVLCVSFILPSTVCDSKLNVNSQQQGWLNAVIFIGMMIGGYFWGSLSDFQGRRKVLLWSLTVNGIGGLMSSLCQSYGAFMVMRFISGIGVGGSMPVIFSYFVEFQPKHKRGTMISVLATFWMAGNIVAAGLAWLVIPHIHLGYTDSSGFVFNSWRIFVALCTIPSLTSAVMFVLMPESPKYLMERGNEDKALGVLRRVYMSNNGLNSFSSYKVKNLKINRSEGNIEEIYSTGACRSCEKNLEQLFSSTQKLFYPSQRRITLIMAIIYFTLSFGYYGLWMWFPELFKRVQEHNGPICESVGKSINSTVNSTDCSEASRMDTTIYFDGFLTALSNLPGNIFTIIVMDRIGRKPLLSVSMVVSGLSVFFLWFVSNKTQSVIMSCLFGGISVIGWNALDVLGTEVFPTAERSTAFGLMSGIGRIASILANVIFGELVDVHCAVPMLMVAVFMVIGGASVLLLPNTTKVDLL